MSVIIRLQNLPLSAISIDIRNFFLGLAIPDGGVHIVGGAQGDAFIAFSTDEDARQAMQLSGEKLKDSTVRLSLSSRNEMFKVIEQARVAADPEQQQIQQTPSIPSLLNRQGLNNPPSAIQSNSPPKSSPINMPNFSSFANGMGTGMGMLGMGMNNASNNNNANNFLGQQNSGGMISSALMSSSSGMNNNPGFPSSSNNTHNILSSMGSNHQQQANDHHHHQQTSTATSSTPFGMPPSSVTAGLGMSFPQMMSMSSGASSSGMPSMNAVAMMGMNHPPPNMMNNNSNSMTTPQQGSSNVFSSRPNMTNNGMQMSNPILGNNQMNHLGLANNNSQQMNLSGNSLMNPMNHISSGNTTSLMNLPTNLMNHLPPPGNNNPNLPNTNQMNHFVSNNNTMGNLGALNNNSQMNPNLLQQHPQLHQQQNAMRQAFSGVNSLMGGIPQQRQIGPPRQTAPLMMGNIRNPNAAMGLGGMRPGFNSLADANNGRSRSPSHERRDRDSFRKDPAERRRRSRSRDRRRRSRSRSHSPNNKGRLSSSRRDSRDKGSRSESSPEKIRSNRRDSRDVDPPATPFNTTDEHHAAIKLTGIPNDASFREIKDFLRVDVMGGGDGTVRLYDEGIAYVKLDKASDFPRAFRSNGRRMRSSVVSMEGISIERWVDEYKLNKSRMDRDVDRDKERDRERDQRQDRQQHKDRDDRSSGSSSRPSSSSSGRPDRIPRQSRFNSVAQSSYIVIRNLPPTVTTKDVSSRLLTGIALVDIVVSAGPPSHNGRHTAVAHIKLDSPDAAQQAIDLIVRSQDGSHLVVEVSTNEDFNMAKQRTPGLGRLSGDSSSATTDPAKFVLGDPNKQTSIFDLEPGLDEESCSVMLKGAPPSVSERDVFDFFSDIGIMPMNVKIMYETDGNCNGQVICEFPDPHKARRATTKDGMMFGRGLLHVELLPSGRKRMLGGGEFLGGQGKSFRPSLLGLRPGGGGGPSRFGGPPGPNPFVQALQGGGPRSSNPRSRGPRFGGPRQDFGGSGIDKDDRLGGGRGRGRGRGGGGGQLAAGNDSNNTVAAAGFGRPGCVLALENVPYSASMDQILAYLSSELKLEIAREKIIRRFDESEKPTGDARVAFDSAVEAKLAYDRLVGTKMWNRLISYTIV